MIHTIPVPKGWSPAEAWALLIIANGVEPLYTDVTWVNIEVDATGRFVRVLR